MLFSTTGMKVLSIGIDRKLFEEDSAVLQRSLAYATKMEELHIIVFTRKGFKKKTIGNLHIYPTNSFSRLFYVFDAYSTGKNIIENWKLKIGNCGDVVISTQDPFETGLVGYFLKNNFRLPLQFQIHTDFLSKHFKTTFLNYLRVSIANFLIPHSDGLRIVGKNIEQSIKRKFPNIKSVINVLPVFVDIEKIMNQSISPKLGFSNKTYKALATTAFPQFKFVIFMASRLTREKRIDVALKAFKKVLENFAHAGLVIAGEGSERGHLESMVRDLKLRNNVVFIGWQTDLVSYFKTADLFLLTSEYEGYGMTLIEAGASGCPIVTSNIGVANTDLFVNHENSLVCPVGDVECFSKSINEIISNNSHRELFARAMQDSIKLKSISKEEYVAKYVGLLEKLLQKNG